MIGKIDHIGVAVKNLEASLAVYRDALGFGNIHTEEVPTENAKVGFIPIGESEIELLESTTSDGVLARFIDKRGEGVHHIALTVESCQETLDRLKAAGVRTVDDSPRPGAKGTTVAFVHPSSTGGVLIELVQHPKAEDHRGH
ncbi:MAG: methylmalonyl-CoA epimerase [Chloroflexi bacterium]|nr:methylmalonyl-CoA epimerase [Chloroflexota bacterium]